MRLQHHGRQGPATAGVDSRAPTPTKTLDLGQRGDLSAASLAYYALRMLAPGQIYELIADEDPRLLMDTVTFQLRGRIHWDLVQEGPPRWRVRARPRDDVPAASLMDLLIRDHERLDRLFARALACVNRRDAAAANACIHAFGYAIRRHLHVENDLLAPTFVAPRDPLGADPTSTMLREHDQILEQLAMIETCFEESEADRGAGGLDEAVTIMALLSGTLAKHEHREEQNLFPHWSRALARSPDRRAADELLARIAALLESRVDRDC